MTKGVFLHRPDSIYDDRPEERYQFPKQYYGRAAQSIGDWIIYYEPVKGGGRGYFATARLDRIVPDPTAPGMFLALIEPGSYLPFEREVAFNGVNGVVERGLLNDAGKLSGRAQAAMRPISNEDFSRIIDLGIPEEATLLPRVGAVTPDYPRGVAEEHVPFVFEQIRDRVERLISRPVRDRVFRTVVIQAYDSRCAISGLKFINGGGRAEVEAAHIRPVEHDGPDTISNGIALSGTAHWMFDRGLITLSDDLDILVSRHVNDIDSVWRLANPTRKAFAPSASEHRPHPRFLQWHRDNCFKI